MICQAQFITHVEPANSSEVRALVFVVLWSLLSALWDPRVREAVSLGKTDSAVSQAPSAAAVVHSWPFFLFYSSSIAARVWLVFLIVYRLMEPTEWVHNCSQISPSIPYSLISMCFSPRQ